MTACDRNISVDAQTTSCGFAQNVFYAYWTAGQAASFDAWSPTTRSTYDVRCAATSVTVTCRTPDRAKIRFPVAAVDAYTEPAAQAFAATHDLGPDEPATENPRTEGNSGEAGCDTNYAGACLDPSAYDYDCKGGSGDGPAYTGRVEVVGDDPYDLDRDGDGVACDI